MVVQPPHPLHHQPVDFFSDYVILHLKPLGLLSVGNYLLVEWFSPGHI